jgi:hypothetical protein
MTGAPPLIYDFAETSFESEKERNLYYKIFAGYLFNELVPGYDSRVQAFFELLNNPVAVGQAAPSLPESLDPRNTHVSFDNHLYLFQQAKGDCGEFADILLHDFTSRTLVAIEAKLHSDWSHESDIVANQTRHSQLVDLLPTINVVPVLLLTERGWEHVKQRESNEQGNYRRFVDDPQCRYRVILWAQIASIIKERIVREFLYSQLSRNDRGFFYRSDQDWFHLASPMAPDQ